GDAKITAGHGLKARYVIHTVGPVWNGGAYGERNLLASCYRRSLELAAAHSVTSIAFPCISTGVYDYPKQAAAEVAVRTVKSWLATRKGPLITFCCFSENDLEIYKALLDSDPK